MTKDDLLCWIIAIEGRMSRFRFESPGWDFHADWWSGLNAEYDKLPWKVTA